MRDSRVLKKLRGGEVATCLKMNLSDARAVEIAAQAGFDCLWTCMEHVPNDFGMIENAIRAAKTCDTDMLVRVARGSYSDYIRPLEMDAAGIMVPHCMGLEDAANVVKMTRFYPVGLRPMDGGNADGAYCGVDFQDYLRQANEQRFVVVQIEDVEALDELEAIAALPGIDMLFFGPGDFSQSLGAPGVWDHPELLSARQRVAEVAVKHGKFAGTVASVSNAQDLIGLGYRFLSIGADVVGLSQYCQGLLAEFQEVEIADGNQSLYGGK
jgi:4-hydroxy-2-oxoheptanedioate aldolase